MASALGVGVGDALPLVGFRPRPGSTDVKLAGTNYLNGKGQP